MGIINNAAQEAAIRHETGPALVLAGPGSGKTYVITNRLKYLTENLDILVCVAYSYLVFMLASNFGNLL